MLNFVVTTHTHNIQQLSYGCSGFCVYPLQTLHHTTKLHTTV